MTEPSRLRETSRYPAARALLDAGLSDNPRRGAARQAAAGLGLSASALATVTSSTAAAGSLAAAGVGVGASGAGLVTAGAASSMLALVGQWLGIGIVSGLCLAGGTVYFTSSRAPSTRAASVAGRSLEPLAKPSTRALARATGAQPERAPVAETPEPSAAVFGAAGSNAVRGAAELSRRPELARPNVARAAPVNEPAGAPRLDLSSARGRLGREVSSIDEARRALAAGNSARALTTLDRYAAIDRTGTLDREAQILRIQALTASGQMQAAAPLARSYLHAYPADPHASMLEQLLAGLAAEPKK
ncbi:MAG: hypothetical protein ABI488_17340 [Polyangiaceae bacterium]